MKKFKFIDLFAGIGGFHMAMHDLGGECVFASEIDKFARKTYEENFSKISPKLFKRKSFNDDIRKISPDQIPDFDVLCAGFPCQPFSQAGHKKGFNDNHNSERGNLFFNIAEIIAVKNPRAIFLENVRGLSTHDNGNTIKVIRSILEDELGYSIYIKIIRATDYGLPQHRPRTFIIGFKNEGFLKGFSFPLKTPLKFNMSDVWGGKCAREVGFTLRVGGRGSTINDRRNWDAYYVDGIVKTLTEKEGKKMQGFPESFEFNVSRTQAMKQLGNSVAVDAIRAVGESMLKYMTVLKPNKMKNRVDKANKGEWSELLVLIKLLFEQRLFLSDKDLNKKIQSFNIKKVTTRNLNLHFYIIDKSTIESKNIVTNEINRIDISALLNETKLDSLKNLIINLDKPFTIPEFDDIRKKLSLDKIKGGTSSQKSDIVLDIKNDEIDAQNEGFGIKSFLGNSPTLLNASGSTNFIFRVDGFDNSKINEVNEIETRTKLIDRILFIEKFGGELNYIGAERETIEHNLKISDSLMPIIIGHLLLSFYKKRISNISEIVDEIHNTGDLNKDINYGDKNSLIIKIKRLLIDVLLGFFAGKKWDGNYLANGTIVMKKTGDCVGFHIIDSKSLKDYLFENIRLETPSTTRHRFGKIYKETGKLYFKLNLQLRFI